MTEADKQFDFPADGSDSVTPNFDNISRLTEAERAEQAKGWRQAKAALQGGSIAVPEVVEPVQPELPLETVEVAEVEPRVEKRSLGGTYGH